MIDSYIWIKENYETVYKRWVSLTGDKYTEWDTHEISCEDVTFEDEGEWCFITLYVQDSTAEEILMELANGNRLVYFFSDDSQMDCEFLVMENNQIIRKRYIYADTPELDEDEGVLLCEENKIQYWNDVDYIIEIARENPDKLFER